MSNEERKVWLESLKVGDEVAFDDTRVGAGPDWEVTKITAVTPSGRIRVEKYSLEFNPDGWERGVKTTGRHNWGTRTRTIEPVTKKIKDDMRCKYLMARLDNQKWRHFDLDKLERIVAIIDE